MGEKVEIGALGSKALSDQLSRIQDAWDLRQWMRERGLMADDECFDGSQIYKVPRG